jgi:hypothetical protein
MGDEPGEKHCAEGVGQVFGGKFVLVKYSRVWSRAMMTMTRPRSKSTEAIRFATPARTARSPSIDVIVAKRLDALAMQPSY